MRLKSIHYQNFKGLKDFELVPDGENLSVFGDNETGKTTLADGALWLLTGKDSEGRADFEIKPLREDGSEINNLDSTVEAAYIMDSGEELSLSKTFREKWTQRRGAPKGQKEFTGHETKLKIDDVPKKKKEFDSKIAELIGSEKTYQLLTDPFAFSRLPWKEQREIIIEICGNVPDAQIIESNPDLSRLNEIIGKATADDHRAKVGARRSAINDRIKEIPARIDELSNSLPVPVNVKHLSRDLKDIEKDRTFHEAEKKEMESDSGAAARAAEISRLKAERNNIAEDHRAAVNKDAEKLESSLKSKEGLKYGAETGLLNLRERLERNERFKALEEKTLSELAVDFDSTNSNVFEYQDADICPTCGQPLPEDQIAAARKKAEADFNAQKADALKMINQDGKAAKKELERLSGLIEEDKKTISAREDEIKVLDLEISDLETDLNTIKNRKLPDKWEELNREILRLEGDKAAETPIDTSEIDGKIAACKEKEAEIQKKIAGQEAAAKSRLRIDELEKEEKELSAEYEKLEAELDLLDRFTIAKVKAIDERISENFSLCRFKMFDIQINGGIAETCQIMFKGIPWGSMNNAARINCGLELCDVLGSHYNFYPPIFIDNAESVTELIKTKAQQIRLYVDSEADELTIKS